MNKCPKCGEIENFHYNYDYSKAERPILDILCNECGELFSPSLDILKKEPKLETLEEATEMNENIAWELAKKTFEENEGYKPNINDKTHELMVACLQEGILSGAKWQQERSYSEEEVIELINKREDYMNSEDDILDYKSINEWFEQFKKK